MVRRIGLALCWLGFVGYAVGLAPPEQPDTGFLIVQLSTGAWADLNPAIVALFNLMGIWPLVYSCLVLVDGRDQKVPAWPFVVGSFGLGAFALLPYLVLRSPNPAGTAPSSLLLKVLESRWLGAGLLLGAAGLMGYGLLAGDWVDFLQQWQTSRFIHVMSLDFCALWLLVPTLLGDDMARRGLDGSVLMAVIAAVPLLGVASYLALRPPLPEAEPAVIAASPGGME
jgi:hypothetical protein